MKRSTLFLLILCVLLTACTAGQPVFVYPPTASMSPAATLVAQAPTPEQPAEATAPLPTPTLSPPATALPAATAPTATLQATATVVAQPTAVAGTAGRQWQASDRLPIDPEVHEGKLANGLTYIVRRNAQPGNRAELRLVVNAGSVLEADDQRGLAHFLEHMLFNGTCRFPRQDIVTFLESNGMRFGADLNASTGFDETEYILRIPLDDPAVLDKGLDVLVDWASCATLDPAEVDRERGVIVEEHRLRDLNAQGRIQDQMIEELLAGSQYAERLPIGDMTIVQNAKVEALRRFYTDWYRPDLMAVIAVGDFDASLVEQRVRAKFAGLANPKNAKPRPSFSVPDFSGTRYLVAKDPENPASFVQLYVKQPPQAWGTVALYRQILVENLFFSMLNQRFAELVQAGNAPFAGAGADTTSLVRTAAANVIQAQVQETNTVPALDTLLSEVERVRRYGFTAPEIERAKTNLLAGYRNAYEDRTTASSTRLVDEYIRHFLTGEDIPGIAVEYEVANLLVPQISLEEVNREVKRLASADGRLILAITPEKQGFTPPTEQELAAVVNGIAAKELKPYAGQAVAATLMTDIPQPAGIISQTTIAELNTTELKLANGVRVLLKPTQIKANEVLFAGVAPGGSSLLPDADVPAARLAGAIVANSGVGRFSPTELEQLLTGKSVSVTPSIRELSQRIDGNSSPRDLETAFQLIYLYATQPRMDENTVQAFKSAAAAQLANRALDPQSALEDAITQLLYGDSVRWQPVLPLAVIQNLDAQRTLQIYKDRFADMSGFSFTFVGNFDLVQATELARRYLGNLPGGGRVEKWRNLMPAVPGGVREKDIYKGNENRAEAQIIYTGASTGSLEQQVQLKVIRDVLDLRLLAELREKLSATYSPAVRSRVDLWPEPRYQLVVDFTADPARTKELLAATFVQVEDLRAKGPTEQELATAKEQEKRTHEGEQAMNAYWLGLLVNYTLDPAHQDPRAAGQIDALIDKLTAADIQKAAQQFLKADQHIQVVLWPGQAPAPTTVEARLQTGMPALAR